ncbi:hypothetical protein WKI68_17235 [Streptomyces sp. MS1.HAVA.3]|uniref:AT hook motif protein n=1 Tax=Streptomyces caledonius TaxID=3134107 RepID=A0ABU8U465_9ACTN
MTPGGEEKPAGRQPRKQVLLRLDPQVYDALARWAGEELRSANAQIEFLLRRALAESGRLPSSPAPSPAEAALPNPRTDPPPPGSAPPSSPAGTIQPRRRLRRGARGGAPIFSPAGV